jgi:hypothetical protein
MRRFCPIVANGHSGQRSLYKKPIGREWVSVEPSSCSALRRKGEVNALDNDLFVKTARETGNETCIELP